MPTYYAQTSGTQTTNATSPTPMPGLSIKIPAGVQDNAIVTLNVPNPYAQGNDYPGGWFGISVNGNVLPAIAVFTYGIQNPPSTNRMPTTLVVAVPLANAPQNVQAVWQGIRGSTVVIDTPASLSAVIA